MKALVLLEDKVLKYSEVAMPEPKQGEVLVKVHACGICGSDIDRGFGGKAYHYPLVMGHEFSGVVEKSFPGGKYKPGDPVAGFPLIPCKQCAACQTGDFAQCSDYDYYGSRRDGGFAEYVAIPEENLFRVPDHVNLSHAAMTEPAAVALHGVRRAEISVGSSAVVYGCGPIGNMTAQWLRIAGCDPVIVVDVDRAKLDLAESMGFVALNSAECDPVERIASITGGEGAKIVVEAVGLPVTFLNALRSAGRGGQVVFMGNIRGTFEVGDKDFSQILRKELRIYGTWNSKVVPRPDDDWSVVLEMMDRKLIVAPLISHTPSLDEGERIFNDIAGKKLACNKVLFKP
ncbi:L-iditol 2-dehydrogenase [Ereboglobus sp. PH5-5]|uniref:galactitol-1-phosphate 5-dehydrogenase n=1 Tax=unclassified Ereboglobus TaxID=2626932 RepID=UPI0024050ED3|nr:MULTISPECIES: galactitol-1-phosphate 5-dehydrogenase [unclassified Ereboglobus]MDF9827853.1 L-iditol 2-dehydrogenase [Ereboglobus sp. PH5-10]MDF9833528.1 L-iditol 2-dehydrogenase [Ereboglobus sp. PH5-5]